MTQPQVMQLCLGIAGKMIVVDSCGVLKTSALSYPSRPRLRVVSACVEKESGYAHAEEPET